MNTKLFVSLLSTIITASCSSVSAVSPEQADTLLFQDTYLIQKVKDKTMVAETSEQIYKTHDSILLKRYKKDGQKEKLLSCQIDPHTYEVKSVDLIRKENGAQTEHITISVNNRIATFVRDDGKRRETTIKIGDGRIMSVPDALHFSIGKRNLQKGEEQRFLMITWDGSNLEFLAKGMGVAVDEQGKVYNEVYVKPMLPFFARALVQWKNTYWFDTDEPYSMALFEGKTGPFSEPIRMWRKSTGQITIL